MTIPAPGFENADSAELLDELRRLERAATVRAQGYWFVLVVFGVIMMFSSNIAAEWLGLYWAVASPIGAVLVVLWYRWRAVQVVGSSWWFLAIPLWIIVGATVVDEVMSGQSGFVAAYCVVGIGLFGFAVLERSVVMGAVAVATPVVAGLMSLIDKAEPPALPSVVGFLWFFVGAIVWAVRV